MHSTIGAFSAGVPVIPVAYSRKFNGLFNTLEYPYYIDAKGPISIEEAIEKTLSWIGQASELKKTIDIKKAIYQTRLQKYVEMAASFFTKEMNK
jgi:polysaccharide pyruvyl transferase WcaK-like protein